MSQYIPPYSATRTYRCLLLIISVVLCCVSVLADTSCKVIGLDMRDGLPESRVRSLCCLPDGRVAVLTAGYISVFDGSRFISRPLDGAESVYLSAYDGGVSVDNDGNNILWIKKGARLFGYDFVANEMVHDPTSHLGTGLPTGEIANFFIDGKNRSWVTLPDRGLFLNEGEGFKRIATLPVVTRMPERVVANDSVVALCYPHGFIDVMEISSGRIVYSGSAFSPVQADSLKKDISVELVGERLMIGHDYQDKHTHRGVVTCFDLHKMQWNESVDIPFHLFDMEYSQYDNTIYVVGDTIATIDMRRGNLLSCVEIVSPGCDLSYSKLSSVLVDNSGGIWFGTTDSGVLYHNGRRITNFVNEEMVFPFGKRPVYNSAEAKKVAEKVASGITNCAVMQNDSYTYVGTRKGLMIVAPDTTVTVCIDSEYGCGGDDVQSIVADEKGDIWFATSVGISLVSRCGDGSYNVCNYGKLDGIELNGKEFRGREMAMDSLGIIHVGYAGGTYSFDPEKVKRGRWAFAYNTNKGSGITSNSDSKKDAYLFVKWMLLAFVVGSAIAYELRLRYRSKENVKVTVREQGLGILLNTDNHQIESVDEQFLARLRETVDMHLQNEELTVQKLSELMAMDRTVLYRKMQTLTGVSPSAYIRTRRMKVAARLLTEGKYPVSVVAGMVGFPNARYFSKVFKEEFGVIPTQYKG